MKAGEEGQPSEADSFDLVLSREDHNLIEGMNIFF